MWMVDSLLAVTAPTLTWGKVMSVLIVTLFKSDSAGCSDDVDGRVETSVVLFMAGVPSVTSIPLKRGSGGTYRVVSRLSRHVEAPPYAREPFRP